MKFLPSRKEHNLLTFFIPVLLSLCLLFSLISISAVQILISLSLILYLVSLFQKKQKFAFPSFFWLLIVYAFFSLLSSFFSVNPEISLKDSRELLLFLFVPMIYTCFQKKEDIVRANYALLASAYLSSLKSLFYYFFKALPGERITGFMGHYMTQAGLLLLFSCLALSIFVFSHKKIKFLWAGGLLLALVALSLTLTRSAWVGLVAAAFLILLLYKPLTLVAIPLMIGIFFLVSPRPLKQRAFSIFSLKNHTNQQRIEYIRAGIQIIKDFPYFGTGPDTVEMVFQNPKYGLSEESKRNVHLHNNIIQIAAERGIQTLLIWLTFITWTFISLARLLHNKDPSIYPIAVAAMAAVVALFTAGLFEYNFADSEITTLFLYLITIPFTLSRIQKKDRSNPTFHDERT